MTDAVRRRVLEPFFTTKGPGRGSGLGLPQALGMARQLEGGLLHPERRRARHDGDVVAAVGAGQAPEAAAQSGPRAQKGKLAGLRVLLVDDDDVVRAATAQMLSFVGCDVRQAADGIAALDHLLTDLDLVIADYAMPGLNGAELAERVARVRPGLPVLLVTGYADPKRLGEAWRGPLLTKPFDLEALEAAVREAAEQTVES